MWMLFDILVIIDEIKKFYRSERGTVLSLIVILFLEVIAYNFVYNAFTTHLKHKPDFVTIYIFITIATLIFWLFDRHIFTSRKKANIGIAQFDLVDINMKSVLPGEARFTIREELNQYIYTRLMHDNRYFDMRKYIKVIVLPPRFAIDRYHEYSPWKYRFLDFLITGTIYNEPEKLSIHPSFVFVKDLPVFLFDEIKDHLAKKTKFDFYVDGKPNLALDKVLHEITYIGLIYAAIIKAHNKQYLQADELIQHILSNLDKLYKSDDKSVNFGDLEFLRIEAMLYFLKAKNLHKYANMLMFNKDKVSLAREKFKEASDAMVKRADILKKIYKEEHNLDYDVLDHSYIYAIGLLAKEQDEAAGKKLLRKIDDEFKDEANSMFAEALFAERMDHLPTAQKLYLEILHASPKNKFALRRLVSLYFREGNMQKAFETITKLYAITKKEVYDDEYYDIRVCTRYIIASFTTLHFPTAITSSFMLVYFLYANKIESLKRTNI